MDFKKMFTSAFFGLVLAAGLGIFFAGCEKVNPTTPSVFLVPDITANIDASSVTGNTTNSTDKFSPSSGSGGTGSDDIYQFILTGTTTITLSLCSGTSMDTVMYVRASTTGADLYYSDDACGFQSSITASFAAGTYYVIVDGFSSLDYGAYSLAITSP